MQIKIFTHKISNTKLKPNENDWLSIALFDHIINCLTLGEKMYTTETAKSKDPVTHIGKHLTTQFMQFILIKFSRIITHRFVFKH